MAFNLSPGYSSLQRFPHQYLWVNRFNCSPFCQGGTHWQQKRGGNGRNLMSQLFFTNFHNSIINRNCPPNKPDRLLESDAVSNDGFSCQHFHMTETCGFHYRQQKNLQGQRQYNFINGWKRSEQSELCVSLMKERPCRKSSLNIVSTLKQTHSEEHKPN